MSCRLAGMPASKFVESKIGATIMLQPASLVPLWRRKESVALSFRFKEAL